MNYLRIRFKIKRGISLNLNQIDHLTLQVEKITLKFRIQISKERLYNVVTFTSNEFNHSINNLTIQKIKNSFYLLGIEHELGILFFPNKNERGPSNYLKEQTKNKLGVTLLGERFGIDVFSKETEFISVNTDFEIILPTNEVESVLNNHLKSSPQISERLERAIEIYNNSLYTSQPARFILQMSALEVLIEQPNVSEEVQNLVDSFMDSVCSKNIEKHEKDSIIGSLKHLKKASISKSGKALVKSLIDEEKRYNSFEPKTFFTHAYNLRSKFVHSGITETKKLSIQNIEMDKFIKDILKAYFISSHL